MSYGQRGLRSFFLMISLIFVGCSTLEVQRTYRFVGEESSLLTLGGDAMELYVKINPDTLFSSMGVFGVPVVPIYVKTNDPTEISLEITLTLHGDSDFSFAPGPCLMDQTSNLIWPYKVEVSAVALYQDDGSMYRDKQKRWNKVPNFYAAKDRVLSLSASGTERISRERIFQHYGYTGVQKWDYLKTSVIYKYKCQEACPEQLELISKDLAVVGDMTMLNGTYRFEKSRITDYRFTRQIQ